MKAKSGNIIIVKDVQRRWGKSVKPLQASHYHFSHLLLDFAHFFLLTFSQNRKFIARMFGISFLLVGFS